MIARSGSVRRRAIAAIHRESAARSVGQVSDHHPIIAGMAMIGFLGYLLDVGRLRKWCATLPGTTTGRVLDTCLR
jgi:hypothetical protein